MNIVIPTYAAERQAGIAEQVATHASIAYDTQLSPVDIKPADRAIASRLADISVAGRAETIDLYPLNTVLVSTGWNKNTDVFGPEETWAARHTPEDKKFNYEHDETDIIGHITSCVAVDDDFNPIDGEEAPDKFHIVTSAVLYKYWKDDDLQERMNEIIAGCAEGEWFVSMEALFTDFDYAVITPDGKHGRINRSEATAFLTKHLRVYGGTGEYNGNQLGRLLKNITFSGKGLVRKPANAGSIILPSDVDPFVATEDTVAEIINNDNDSDSVTKENRMSQELIQSQLDEAKADNKALREQVEALKEQVSKAGIETLEAKIAELEEEVKASEEKQKVLAQQLEDAKKENSEASEKLEAAEAQAKEAQKELDEVKAAQIKTARVASLVSAGKSEEEAKELVDTFASMSEEQFTKFVEVVKAQKAASDDAAATKMTDDEKKKKKDDAKAEESAEAAQAAADEQVIDSAKPEGNDPDLTSAGVDDRVESVQADVAAFMSGWGIGSNASDEE